MGFGCATSYETEPDGLFMDAVGVSSFSGGGSECLDLDLDRGGGVELAGGALGVMRSEGPAQGARKPDAGGHTIFPGQTVKGEPRPQGGVALRDQGRCS